MPVQFHKMHCAGNDFVLLDYRRSELELDSAMARQIADRRHGVGCDQILLLKSSDIKACTTRYEIFNTDGSTASQCGNGVRCIALYLQRRGEFVPPEDEGEERAGTGLLLEGPAGVVRIELCDDGEFECVMGEPRFAAVDHITTDGRLSLQLADQVVQITAISMGNPHAVMVIESVETAPIDGLGRQISHHEAFPKGCNAGFAEIVDTENIKLRVFERGVGETLACGSGACAAVAALHMENQVAEAVNVFLPGGHLVIKWRGPGHEMTMKGPATHVFRGTLDE